MSWDIVLLKSKIDISDKQAQPECMGEKIVLIEEFEKNFSLVDFSNKTWGVFNDGQTSIEINIGTNEKVYSIMLHVRGGGDPFDFIKKTCDYFKWSALDGSTGEYFDLASPPRESWERWKKYRDKIKNG